MKLIYTTDWTREKVRYDWSYKDWLNSLENNDLIVLQEFIPADKAGLSLGIEMWRFTVVKLWNNTISVPQSKFINREKGYVVYWNTDSEWGDEFPARIVPLHKYALGIENIGDKSYGHKPIYEPLFLYQHRYVYLLSRGNNHRHKPITDKFGRRYYRVECEQGYLYHCFSPYIEDKKDIEVEGFQFLYSEYLQP